MPVLIAFSLSETLLAFNKSESWRKEVLCILNLVSKDQRTQWIDIARRVDSKIVISVFISTERWALLFPAWAQQAALHSTPVTSQYVSSSQKHICLLVPLTEPFDVVSSSHWKNVTNKNCNNTFYIYHSLHPCPFKPGPSAKTKQLTQGTTNWFNLTLQVMSQYVMFVKIWILWVYSNFQAVDVGYIVLYIIGSLLWGELCYKMWIAGS